MPVITRRESIDSETGNRIAGDEVATPVVALAPSFSALDTERKKFSVDRLQDVIKHALLGDLPKDFPVQPWNVDKLNDTHIEMIFDSIAGMGAAEIGEKYGYQPGQVSKILLHPDALHVKTSVLAAASDRVTDVSARLQHLSHEALNVKADILRDTRVAAQVRDKVATDLLDRAGYAPKRQLEVKTESEMTVKYMMPAQAARGLASILDESKRVANVDYTQHLRKPQDDEVAQAADLRLSAGHTQPSIKPPLDPSLGAVEAGLLDDEEEPGVFRLHQRSA